MKITVIAVYEGIGPKQLKEYTRMVFDSSWAAKEFQPKQIEEMKKDFLDGEDVVVQSKSPDGLYSAMTSWKLEK